MQRPEQAAYSLYETRWGIGLVAAVEGLIVRIYLPDGDREALTVRLAADIGTARLESGSKVTDVACRKLEDYFAGRSTDLTLPLDLSRLSEFQKRVVEAAMRIPRGSVRTYGWLAGEAGSPRAARACGQVMAANRFPIVVPCHRVVAGNGGLGGFSAGLGWKERLLALEGCRLQPQERA